MNLKYVLAGALIAAATPTFAADLAPAPMEPIAPVVLPMDWTGFYVGAQIGYSWASSDSTINNPFGDDIDVDPDADGVLGGLYVGYNAQFNQIVIGLEGDIELSGVSGDATIGGLGVGTGLLAGSTLFASADETWRGSVRARLGYAIDTFMPYITGGVAWSDVDVDSTLRTPGGVNFNSSFSQTYVGWTIGAGLEWAFTPNLIGRVEYRYTDFGSGDDDQFNDFAPNIRNSVDFKDNAVRVGIAYKF
jgi:outer membrane immunogenic protein